MLNKRILLMEIDEKRKSLNIIDGSRKSNIYLIINNNN
jgi:hypothetical protein